MLLKQAIVVVEEGVDVVGVNGRGAPALRAFDTRSAVLHPCRQVLQPARGADDVAAVPQLQAPLAVRFAQRAPPSDLLHRAKITK